MNIYEFEAKVYFNKNVYLSEHHYYTGKIISKIIYHVNSPLKEEHYLRKFKPYVYSNLDYVKDKIYKAGKKYNCKIRTVDKKVAENILRKYEDNYGGIEIVNQSTIDFEKIPAVQAIIPVSPVILMDKNRKFFNPDEDDISIAVNLINGNASKKANYFLNMDLWGYDFIDFIKITNRYPIIMKYKNNVRMLGNKFLIIPKQDEISQKIVKLLYGVGLGIKNSSMGTGFFNIGV
jgi:CRISPR-associated endoribonuclease Cas6